MKYLPTLRATGLACALSLAAVAASAADFTFAGTTDSGLWPDTSFSGSFSFAGSAASADGDVLLTSFQMVFNGQSWDLAGLDAGAVAVFAAGTPLGLALSAGTDNPALVPSIEFVPGFSDATEAYLGYRLDDASGTVLGFGSYTLTDVTPAVPEPSTYALLAAGLALVGAAARRRRA